MNGSVQRVRVPERLTVIDTGDGEFRLHSLTFSLAITDDADGIVSELLDLLVNPMSLDEIVDALSVVRESIDRESVEAAVAYLLQAGALEVHGECGPLSVADRSRFRAQINFFSHFTPPADTPAAEIWTDTPRTGEDFQARLRTSHVAVLGAGQLGSQLIHNVALSGVGRLSLIDAEPVTSEDVHLGGWFDATDVGACRAEAVRDRVLALDPEITVGVVPEPEDVQAVEKLLGDATFAVLVRDHYRPAEYDVFNRAALATRTPWTSGRRAGFEFQIGPTVLPFETSCFTCADLRLKSNLADFGEHRLVESFLERGRLQLETLVVAPGTALLALEVVKALSSFTAPATYASIYTFDLLTMGGQLHQVLKVPRCPACGRPAQPRPTVHAWQQATESPAPQ